MLVALDPGKTVGWATEDVIGRLQSGQIDVANTWDFLASRPSVELIIMESYGHPKLIDLTPIENIGVVKEWARQNNVPVVMQTPSEGKHFFTDAKLEEHKVFRTPKTNWKHANDAMRHLQYYLKFKRGKEA